MGEGVKFKMWEYFDILVCILGCISVLIDGIIQKMAFATGGYL